MVQELKEIVIDSEQSKNINLFNEKIQYLLKNLIQSDVVSLFVYDRKTQNLNLKLFYDRKNDTFESIKNNDNYLSMIDPQGCIGKVFLTKSSAIHNYITSDKEYFKSYDNALNHKLKSQLIYPIMEDNELLGIFRLSTTIDGVLKKYTSKELALVNSALPYLVSIIKNIIAKENNDNAFATNHFLDINDMLETKKEENIDDDNMLLFLSNTVHDIRTPANSLFGFLELLEEQITDKRLKEFVTNAKESASFINTLTDSILEITKSRYESTIATKTTITTIHFLSELANTFAAKMLEKKIHYFIYISPNIPKEVKVDTLKLKRILINLIGNAYKFTPLKHQINLKIDWDAAESRIKFSIKDTGIGIEKKDQKKLFKSFSQARDDIHKKYGGTGLGLAISAGYVADLGGELQLKSRIDEGSEFYFDIPIEIIDSSPSYEKFYNLEKKILILTGYTEAKYPKFIRNYLKKLGIPEDKIVISDEIQENATHVICFEEKITSQVLEDGKLNKFKLLLVEQKLFSLLNKEEVNGFNVTSKNTYNGDTIYSTIFSGKKLKVLIVDDNKINVTLLESMLAGEYLDISTFLDGEEAFKFLQDSAQDGKAFDILYLDKHMNGLSGTELLKTYRKYEALHGLKPIFAVSISGDPEIDKEEKKLYNVLINKPFNKNDVQEVIALSKQVEER